MMNVFIDINILLDVLLGRSPFFEHSIQVWNLAERRKIAGFVSSASFPSLYYIVRNFTSRSQAHAALIKVRSIFNLTDCTEHIITEAINSKFKDFEDAVQYFSAINVNAACIVTRNTKHFPLSKPPALTPSAFLELNSFI